MIADDPASPAEAAAADTIDRRADRFLLACYDSPPLEVFDTLPDAGSPEALRQSKEAADLLVARRLASYVDEGRTQIAPTNAGRYWALHGGYLAFLKEEPLGGGGGGRQRNPELEALRFTYMKLRLGTFWWSFGLALASFLISIASIAVAVFYRDLLLR